MALEAGKFPEAHGLASWAYTSANKRPCLTLQQDAGPDTHERATLPCSGEMALSLFTGLAELALMAQV